ncbi:MAG TPA: FG-GAP repeat protein [Acidimicrobiales bacterium]|nr:FG-GAP repeat protein [Acidimicrobiales bacterium]
MEVAWLSPRTRPEEVAVVLGARRLTAIITATTSLLAVATPVPARWRQVAELVGRDIVAYDWFGSGVAVSGGTIVAGAPQKANSVGRAYVFENGRSGWHQVAELAPSDGAEYDNFGSPVAVSGGYVVVGGASGADKVYIFTHGAKGWRQAAELKWGEDTGFGSTLGISGGTLVVGTFGIPVGAFVFSAANGWHQIAELMPRDLDEDSQFGRAVAISGGTIVVGAPESSPGETGRAYIFTRSSTGWHQAAEMRGPYGYNFYGISVAASGSTVAVGDGSVVRLYTEGVSGWHQVAELSSGEPSYIGTEGDVAMSGGTVVSGTYGGDSAIVFQRGPTGWHQVAAVVGKNMSDVADFGGDPGEVGVSGNTVVIGADEAAGQAGRAYVFQITN